MKKVLKILLILTGILGIIFIVVTYFMVNSLPGPKEISQGLKAKKTKEVEAVKSSSDKAPVDPENKKLVAEQQAEREKKAAAEKIVHTILEEDPRDIRVCENLGKGQLKGFADLEKADSKLLFGDDARKDPIAEAIRIPIRAVFQDENVTNLFNDILSVDDSSMDKEEKSSFLEKIDFYSRVSYTAAHLYNRKSDFESLADRAVHMSILSRMAQLKPELANTPQLFDACNSIQASIAQGNTVDVKKEREDLLSLIKEAGFTPKELDFDPSVYMKFKVKFTNNSFAFSLDSKEEPK